MAKKRKDRKVVKLGKGKVPLSHSCGDTNLGMFKQQMVEIAHQLTVDTDFVKAGGSVVHTSMSLDPKPPDDKSMVAVGDVKEGFLLMIDQSCLKSSTTFLER